MVKQVLKWLTSPIRLFPESQNYDITKTWLVSCNDFSCNNINYVPEMTPMLWCQIMCIFQLLMMCNIWRGLFFYFHCIYSVSFVCSCFFWFFLSCTRAVCDVQSKDCEEQSVQSSFFFSFSKVLQRIGKPSFDGRPVFLKEEIDENIARWVEDFQMMPQKKSWSGTRDVGPQTCFMMPLHKILWQVFGGCFFFFF